MSTAALTHSVERACNLLTFIFFKKKIAAYFEVTCLNTAQDEIPRYTLMRRHFSVGSRRHLKTVVGGCLYQIQLTKVQVLELIDLHVV